MLEWQKKVVRLKIYQNLLSHKQMTRHREHGLMFHLNLQLISKKIAN